MRTLSLRRTIQVLVPSMFVGTMAFSEACSTEPTAQFIAGCYAAFPHFENFAAYSMFYFAAASYSEMARRLNRGHLVRQFLASDHLPFAAATVALTTTTTRRVELSNYGDDDAFNRLGT